MKLKATVGTHMANSPLGLNFAARKIARSTSDRTAAAAPHPNRPDLGQGHCLDALDVSPDLGSALGKQLLGRGDHHRGRLLGVSQAEGIGDHAGQLGGGRQLGSVVLSGAVRGLGRGGGRFWVRLGDRGRHGRLGFFPGESRNVVVVLVASLARGRTGEADDDEGSDS